MDQYKNAIELANREIIRISDRFHILKSLSEGISSELYKVLSLNITVEKIKDSTKQKTLKERFYSAKYDVNNRLSLKKA